MGVHFLDSIRVRNPSPSLEMLLKQLYACENQFREENDHQGPEFRLEKVFHE
jgi:hypothetical protein